MFKTTKSKIIVLVVFSIICIITTILLIMYKNIDTEEKIEEIIDETLQNVEKDVQGINLKGTYNQNDIELEEKRYTGQQIEIHYYQIRGLKNKVVQEQINKEIEHYALNYYKEQIKDLNEVENLFVDITNISNFSNTMSFMLNYYAKKLGNNDDFYTGTIGINYNIITGEKITIDRLFTSDAPIEDILRQSTYYSLVQDKAEENLGGEFVVKDYGDIEDEVSEIIYLYKKGKITNFYYSAKTINIVYGENKIIDIQMGDYPEYIAIYNRYLTVDSLYERNDIGYKNIYTLSERYRDAYYYKNYQKEKNYFIDVNVMIINFNEEIKQFEENLINEKIKLVEQEIEKVKALADRKSDKFYVVNCSMNINTMKDSSTGELTTEYYEIGNIYQITIHDFEESIEPAIMEFCRQDNAEE